MKFFDDKSKDLKWYNRNYFYLGTIIFIVLNISIFSFFGYGNLKYIGGEFVWNGVFDVSNIFRSFLDTFEHGSWSHVLWNMVSFAIVSLYIERKVGTFNFIFLMLGFSFLSGNITTAARNTVNHHGASSLIYFCYAFAYVDYVFMLFNKEKRNKMNIIMGAIIVFAIYVAMCSNDDSKYFFELYPHNLIFNAAHYSNFFAGIIVTLMINLFSLHKKGEGEVQIRERKPLSKKLKVFYIFVLIINIVLAGTCSFFTLTAINRTNVKCSLKFDCNIDKYDYVVEKEFSKDTYISYLSCRNDWLSNFDYQIDGYSYEIYLDKEHTKQMTNKTDTNYSIVANYPWGYGDTIPLSKELEQTLYVKMFKTYKVEFLDVAEYIDISKWTPKNLQEETLFTTNYSNSIVDVKENATLRFMLESLKYSFGSFKLEVDGTELLRDAEGYYCIENINSDIEISFVLL